MNQKRIGIFPGTFDPLHAGHIAFAQRAAEVCSLEKIYLMPEKAPRLKPLVAPYDSRVDIIKRNIQAETIFSVLQVPAESFSTQVIVPYLNATFHSFKLVLLLGSDVLQTIHLWDGVDEIFKSFELAIGIRSDSSERQCREIVSRLEQVCKQPISAWYINAPFSHISSTQVRARQKNTT